MNQYEALSGVYDRLNSDVDYGAWADFIERIFGKYLKSRPELVLDLACGTGKMTFELSRRGYDMTGVDISADMLSLAKRADTEGKILWLCQSMTEFELYGTVGAVVCCLDGINYLTGVGELEKCFSLVHNYLDPDGIFIFDVNTPYKFENIYADNSYILEDDGIFVAWQNFYNKKSGICDFYLSVFRENGDGTYSRRDECQRERRYTEKKLKSTLEKCGFEMLETVGGYDFSNPAPNCERLYFAARAKK